MVGFHFLLFLTAYTSLYVLFICSSLPHHQSSVKREKHEIMQSKTASEMSIWSYTFGQI